MSQDRPHMIQDRAYRIYHSTPATDEGATASEIAGLVLEQDVKYVASTLGDLARVGDVEELGPITDRRYRRLL